MNDETNNQPSRMSGVAILPWTVSFVLLLVLGGTLAMVGFGFTADPQPAPEMATTEPPAHAEAQQPPETEHTSAAEYPSAEHPSAEHPPAEDEPTTHAPTPEPILSPVEEAHSESAADGPVAPTPPAAMETPTPEVAHTAPPVPPVTPTASAATEAPAVPEVAAAPPAPQVAVVPRNSGRSLAPAPDPGLVESSPQGPLPKIGPDGREPWKVYARPFNGSDKRPRVAIILGGLGLSSAATEAAIQGLPSAVTLAYQPFADNIQQWIRLSRAAGHEVLLNLPMEPVDFPAIDPGPRALFVTLSPEENKDRLRWALSRVSGYVGVMNHMGSRFTISRDAMHPILAELKARGLLFVDARSAARSVATVMASEMQVPRAINDRFLDNREVSRASVDARLAEVERIAKEAGVSIAIGQAFPVTIERIAEWARTLEDKGIALVPISAVVDRQSDR